MDPALPAPRGAHVRSFEYLLKVTLRDGRVVGPRAPQSFTVYPQTADGSFVVQSDRVIALVYPDGGGVINWRGSHGKYFPHLHPRLGAEQVAMFPVGFLKAVRGHAATPGEELGGGVFVAG